MVGTKVAFQDTSQEALSGKEENFEKFAHKQFVHGIVFHPGYERIVTMTRENIKMVLSLQWTLAALFAKTTSALLKRGHSAHGKEHTRKLHELPSQRFRDQHIQPARTVRTKGDQSQGNAFSVQG